MGEEENQNFITKLRRKGVCKEESAQSVQLRAENCKTEDRIPLQSDVSRFCSM